MPASRQEMPHDTQHTVTLIQIDKPGVSHEVVLRVGPLPRARCRLCPSVVLVTERRALELGRQCRAVAGNSVAQCDARYMAERCAGACGKGRGETAMAGFARVNLCAAGGNLGCRRAEQVVQ